MVNQNRSTDPSGNNQNPSGRIVSLSFVAKLIVPVLAVFFVSSCTDLQTANNETGEQETPSKTEVPSGEFLIDSGLLPVPDIESFREAASASKNKSAGTAKRYKRVLVHPKGSAPGSNGAPVVDNFSDALERVESGGTIKVFAGEYVMDELVIINRPVTIEPMGGASVVISSTAGHVFLVDDIEEGLVIFSDLTFNNIDGHSSIAAVASEVLVTGSIFDGTGGYAGAFAWQDAKLTVENSNFSNGVVGAFASGEDTELIIRSSSFSNHEHVTVQYQWGADGAVDESTMTDCGVNGCTRAFLGSQLNMLNNTFSDDISDTEVVGFFHHIVIYSGADGLVSGNIFDGCGHGQCIAGINGSVLEVSDNEFRIYEEHNTRFVIVGSDGTGGNDPEGREVDITVLNNVITGIGGNYENDPNNPDAYAIKLGGILIENLGRMEAYGNTIENANRGISVLSGGILTAGQNNVIQNVHTAVASFDLSGLGQSLANLKSNDFTGYITSILNDTFDPDSDLTCNWWGTAAGPQNFGGGQSSVSISTPWATESVAGSSVTSCTGGI